MFILPEGGGSTDIIDDELKDHGEYQEIKDSLDVFKRYNVLVSKEELNQTNDTEW